MALIRELTVAGEWRQEKRKTAFPPQHHKFQQL
jgi:hypothetical protein